MGTVPSDFPQSIPLAPPRVHAPAGRPDFRIDFRRLRRAALRRLDGIVWRTAAVGIIPAVVFWPGRFPPASRTISRAYVSQFWRVGGVGEALGIVLAFLLWPIVILGCALWLTHKNGAVVAERLGRPRILQFGDQLLLALAYGLQPARYYIFELYRRPNRQRARCYLTRGQAKRGAYCTLRKVRVSCTPLPDKEKFARFCAERQVPTLPVLFSIHGGEPRGLGHVLPPIDLFVKPVSGKGGGGAERWDYVGPDTYRQPRGSPISGLELLQRLCDKSRARPIIVQQRAVNHPAMRGLSNGALSTLRIITCMDEAERPEIMAAVLRMAVGNNVTVDNVHAGGLAAAVDLAAGRLHQATDVGIDARLGWIDYHPDTGGRITGRVLPYWEYVRDLVCKAHMAFSDWAVVGWDVAILPDGPALVEGNSLPDVDLVQRPLQMPFGNARFGELLAYHLTQSRANSLRSA